LEGGFKTTSKNLMPIVGSNLSRMKSAGEVVNIDGKWGLSVWYPAARAQAASKPKAKTLVRAKPPSKARPQQTPASTPTSSQPNAGSGKPKATVPEAIERMKALHAAGKSNGDIAKELGLSNIEVWRALKPKKADAA
jgi:hypothetical protein